MKSAVVIVSHYNAWPTDHLVALLDQMQSIPSGHPFCTRVVVNRAEDKALELPPRHSEVEVYYRENVGYNIGAWDHGWRQPPPADYYLFVQEECVILRPGWLRAFVRAASKPSVGLVGESLMEASTSWEDLDFWMKVRGVPPTLLDGKPVWWSSRVRAYLARHRIDAGPMAEHLQSLVICTRREVLEAIEGFRIGVTKEEAICCEIGMSKSVEGLGLKSRQVGFRPFSYIHHPQWESDRQESARPGWKLRRVADLYLPRSINQLRRSRGRRKAQA